MNWEFYLWISAVAIMAIFLLFTRIRIGKVISISNIAYQFRRLYGKNVGYVFTGVMLSNVFLILPVVLEHGRYFMFFYQN